MSVIRRREWLGAILAIVCAGGPPAHAADEPVPKASSSSSSAEFQAHAKEQATAYEVSLGSEPPLALRLQTESLLRWANPVGGKETHGEVFLWTDRGRPEVVLSLYEFVGAGDVLREHHEFCSLSATNVTARNADKIIWSPTEPGIQMKPIPDAAAPDESARIRLREMRSLANQFTAEKTTREDVTRELRLLPQPLYRYAGAHPKVLDAALFAFVEVTDPEILLLIEASPTEGGHQWTYALARLNSIRLCASHAEKPVWEVPLLPWREALDRPDKPYTAIRIR